MASARTAGLTSADKADSYHVLAEATEKNKARPMPTTRLCETQLVAIIAPAEAE